MKAVAVSLEGLTVGYGRRPGRPVVSDISQTLVPGSFACLVGENGCGKSTLLRTMAGMQRPLSGRVLLDGRDIARLGVGERARLVAVVLTDPVDSGYLTVRDLVGFGRYPYLDWRARLGERDAAVAERAMKKVGIDALAAERMDRLSDGERQKALIARALAQDTGVMLLDEPTAFLDAPRKIEIVSILRDIAVDEGKAVLMSTHDIELALRFADRLWTVSEGAVVSGAPESLALSGALAAAYHSSTVRFDPTTGKFALPAKRRGTVALDGKGAAHRWTAHALERVGFRVIRPEEARDSGAVPEGGMDAMSAAPPPVPSIEIRTGEGSVAWKLSEPSRSASYDTLEALLEALGPR
jgi:iron complex transport system ATP-binding protein